jgi:hypothetical protein
MNIAKMAKRTLQYIKVFLSTVCGAAAAGRLLLLAAGILLRL